MVRVRAAALGVTGEATITVTAGAAAQITLTAQPATLVANGTATATIRALVRDANGNPKGGQNVDFVAAGGTVQPGAASTDARGLITRTFVAGVVARTAVVTATAGVVRGVVSITLTAGAPSQVTLTATPPQIVADGVSTSTITALVRDANGNPKGGQNVDFVAAGGTVQPGAASTDARGLITRTFVAGVVARTAIVTATAGVVRGVVSITLTAGAPSQIALAAAPTQIVADGVSTSTITALVRDAGNNPVSNISVFFNATGGSFVDGVVTKPTDSFGRASVGLRSTTNAQIVHVTAVDATNNQSSTVVSFIPGTPHNLSIGIQPNRLEANGTATATVAVTVSDVNNNLNGNTPVTITTTAGSLPNGAQSIVAATNGAGVASTVLRAGTAVTVATVTARAGDKEISAKADFVAGSPATLTVTAIPMTLIADGVQTAAVTVTVTDRLAHPVTGAQVGFAASLGNITPAAAATGPNGRAAAVFTAGTVVGQAMVTATVAGLTSPVTLTLMAGTPTSMTLAVTPQYLRVGASANVTAEVHDRYANPVAGTPVTFSAPDALGRFVELDRVGATPSHSVTVSTGVNGAAYALLVTTGVGTDTVTAIAAALQKGISITVDNALVMLPIIERKDPPPPPLPVLANGNFEAGPEAGWSQRHILGPQDPMIVLCNSIADPAVRTRCSTSVYIAWLGGRRVAENMELFQTTAALPEVYPAQVKFFYLTFSDRPGSECNRDYARVLANDVEIRRYPLCSTQDTNAWTADLVDLAAFSGVPLTLKFNIVLSGGRLGNFFIDDVALCSDSDLAPDGTPPCAGTQVQADIMAGDLAEAETAGAAVRPDESAPQETPETVDGADQSGVDRLLPVDSDAGSQPSPPDAGEQDNSSDE